MIRKPVIIVASLGRTGTRFFSEFFNDVLTNCKALHEPDILKVGKAYSLRKQFRDSGVNNLVINKIWGYGSLVELSDARLVKKIDNKRAKNILCKYRKNFIGQQPGLVYVESNSGYYGLLDLLPSVFSHYRVVYLVRDGRSWVRSRMNFGYMYNKNWLQRRFTHTWPTATQLPDDFYCDKWHGMTRFQKLCWAWKTLNRYALYQIKLNPQNVRVVRFEDIFQASDRYDHLQGLVDFATDFSSYGKLHTKEIDGWLKTRIHQSQGGFPDWRKWSKEEQAYFKLMCGGLMEELGYE